MKHFFSRKPNILLLDSDPLRRTAVRDALQTAGYFVGTAGNLGAAADGLKEMEPDLLMVAPYIDNMPGQTAADYLRRRRPGLSVLIVAGLMDDDEASAVTTVGKFYVFPKPFTKHELLAAVNVVLKCEWEKRFVFYAPIGPVDGEFLEWP